MPSICAKVRFKSEKAEIRGLCDEIQNELNSSSPPREILVLFHSKEIGQKYAKALQAHGFQIEDLLGKPGTVSKAVLLLYEVLRLITDQSDNLAARFLLQEFFKMDSQWITKIRHISQSQDKSLWQTAIEADGTTEMIISWSEKFKKWHRMSNIIEMQNEIIKALGIWDEPEIQKILAWCNQGESLTLHKLIDSLEKGADFSEPAPAKSIEGDTPRIIIMSMHGAKGLNADAVFVPALENELMPNQWYEPEQRRLLYVSMTRAKRELFLSWAWSRTGKVTYRSSNRAETHRERSGFLDEIERQNKS